MRVEDKQDAAIVLARKFADHQRTKARGSFPVNVTRAVRRDVIPQRVKILTAALGQTFESSLDARQNFQIFFARSDGRIDESFRFQIDVPGLPQESEREASDDAECFLTVNTTARKGHGHGLLHAVMFGEIREINGRLQHRRGNGRAFWLSGFDPEGERRQRQFFILEFDHRADRLARKDVFGHLQAHFDPREGNRRKNAGHQDDGDEACKNQEEKIVAGVQRGERDEEDSGHIDPALPGDAEFHLVADPAEGGALREDRDERDAHPAGNRQRDQRGSAGQTDLAEFRGGAGIKREQKRGRKSDHRENKRANGGAIGPGPELRESGLSSAHFSGRGEEQQIPRSARNDKYLRVRMVSTRSPRATKERGRIQRYREARIPWLRISSAKRRGASWRRRGGKKPRRQAA